MSADSVGSETKPVELTPIRVAAGAKVRDEENKSERELPAPLDVTARDWDHRWYFQAEHRWQSTAKGNGSPIIQLSFNFEFDGCTPSGVGSRDDA